MSDRCAEATLRITPEMMRAGIDAYRRWRYDEEEPEALIGEIFYSMVDKLPYRRGDSSAFTDSSKRKTSGDASI